MGDSSQSVWCLVVPDGHLWIHVQEVNQLS